MKPRDSPSILQAFTIVMWSYIAGVSIQRARLIIVMWQLFNLKVARSPTCKELLWLVSCFITTKIHQREPLRNVKPGPRERRVFRWVNMGYSLLLSCFQFKLLLKLENLLRWSFFTLIYNRSSNIWIISYIVHIIV